jgi:hypothetical protein
MININLFFYKFNQTYNSLLLIKHVSFFNEWGPLWHICYFVILFFYLVRSYFKVWHMALLVGTVLLN